ncbi:hypothetical protein DCC35_06890 [Mangrovivirga cuniculi]|uniref:RHS repeat-associated core domain-containing protein n=1 Tax=Mangrovivirga cuniculi TaxID=2715131 RepID=A0A4D7JUF9_9BACT|nr:hypothetical protein DCC35_06890 [Mangrovivirga cuniculi]
MSCGTLQTAGVAKAYNLDTITYDLNGNITTLNRMDGQGAGMDQMTYNYVNGNQLKGVTDAGTEEGFKDGNNSNDDYDYDANGNMIADRNKGITKITYNHLNLPEEVWFDVTGSKKIVYTYDAAGIKLKKEVFEAGNLIKTTSYIGGMIYENGKLQQIAHAEGRIVPDTLPDETVQFKYQYHHKDHLGNVRMTYGETNDQDVYLATMESENASTEDGQFEKLGNRVPSIAANSTINGNEALRLNGVPGNIVGSAITITVNPGDVVDISVTGYHENVTNGSPLSTSILITALAGAFNPATTGIGESTSQMESAFTGAYGSSAFVGSSTSDAPAAYLNYLYFDTDFNLITGGFVQVPATGFMQHSLTLDNININQVGYVYVYTSYESESTDWVYFDDLTVTHNKKLEIIQSEDYYPFGLTFNEYQRKGFRENNFLYNGKELQDDFDLNWMDYGARMYDAEIGRWGVVDPMSEERNWLSPYNYVQNNPLIRIDPNGALDEWFRNDETGELEWVDVQADENGNKDYNIEGKTFVADNDASFLEVRDAYNFLEGDGAFGLDESYRVGSYVSSRTIDGISESIKSVPDKLHQADLAVINFSHSVKRTEFGGVFSVGTKSLNLSLKLGAYSTGETTGGGFVKINGNYDFNNVSIQEFATFNTTAAGFLSLDTELNSGANRAQLNASIGRASVTADSNGKYTLAIGKMSPGLSISTGVSGSKELFKYETKEIQLGN